MSSFGIGGTNAHVVLESAPVRSPAPAARPWEVLCLSAQTPRALRALASAVADHLAGPGAPALADVAFTLNTGRRPLAHRLAVVCADAGGAIAALRDAEGARAPGTHGEARARAEAIAAAWRSGEAIDWDAYYGDAPGRRVPLPLYPFERVRRWIDAPAPRRRAEPRLAAPEAAAYRATWTRAPELARGSPSAQALAHRRRAGGACRAARRPPGAGGRQRLPPRRAGLRPARGPARGARLAHRAAGRALRQSRRAGSGADRRARGGRRAGGGARGHARGISRAGRRGGQCRGLPGAGAACAPAPGYPEIACRNIDVGGDAAEPEALERFLAECRADAAPAVIALRGRHRWCPTVESLETDAAPATPDTPVCHHQGRRPHRARPGPPPAPDRGRPPRPRWPHGATRRPTRGKQQAKPWRRSTSTATPAMTAAPWRSGWPRSPPSPRRHTTALFRADAAARRICAGRSPRPKPRSVAWTWQSRCRGRDSGRDLHAVRGTRPRGRAAALCPEGSTASRRWPRSPAAGGCRPAC